jgi:hypothetical protein
MIKASALLPAILAGCAMPMADGARLNRQGLVQAEYAMVAGLEDLTVDDDGRVWGLSESEPSVESFAAASSARGVWWGSTPPATL